MKRLLAAYWLLLVPALLASSKPPTINAALYNNLKQKIESTDPAKMDEAFLKEIYKGYSGAKYMLKGILADPKLAAQNEKLGRLRRALDLKFWAQVAKQKGITIELTNQGKQDGHRSDLDETGWAVVGPDGELVKRGRPFDELRRMHEDYFGKEYGIAPEQADVTVMDGDIFLPDYRSQHSGSTEFVRDLSDKVFRLRRNSAAYSVPGANKQQVYNRALEEGRTIQISYDGESGRVLVNGSPLDIEGYVEGKAPIPEIPARMAARYQGVEAVQDWRLSAGNGIENLAHVLSSSGESIARQKYGNRVVDEAFGPMTGQLGKYSRVHGGLAPEKGGLPENANDAVAREQWKRNFIEQIYGVNSGPEFDEIKRVLDVSAAIELDKIGWGPKQDQKHDYISRRDYYYKQEMEEARRLLAEENGSEPTREQVLAKAEQLFVSKNVRVLVRGLIPVLKETFRRDLTAEGRKQYRADFGENFHLAVRKMLFERKIEIAALFETLEMIHDPELREGLRKEILDAAPNAEVRALLEQMSKLAAVDGAIDEWLKEANRTGRPPKPEEILAEIERRKSGAVGNEEGKDVSTETMEATMLRGVAARLGPKNGADFLEAYQQIKAAAREFPSEITREFYQGLSPLLLGNSAMNLVRTYQQECSLGGKAGSVCSQALLATAAQEGINYVPRIGSPYLIFSSLKSINEGNAEGFVTLALGLAALKGFSSGMHLYFVYQIGKTGLEVTYGYALQSMESDQVQQAFMARPVPGKQAERNPFADPAGVLSADTPTFPLLTEIEVPANQWSEEEKLRQAKKLFGTAIRMELQGQGVTVDSPDWEPRYQRQLHRYAFDLPYYQRLDKIYQHFGPMVDKYEKDSSVDLSDHSYDALEACMDANKDSKDSPLPRCLEKAIEESSPLLDAFFNRYLDDWLKKQSYGYQREFYSTVDLILSRDSYRQEMFKKLKTTLIRDYVMHQWMDRRKEEANREMERQTRQLLPKLKRLAELEKARIAATNKAAQSFLDKYEAQANSLYSQSLPPVKPVVQIDWPDFARRVASPGPAIGVSVRGEYSEDDISPKDQWEAVMEAKVVSVKDGPPANLLRTAELESELKPADGKPKKNLVTLEDEVKVTVRSKSGEILGTETGTIYWYDIVDEPAPFKRNISVRVVDDFPGRPADQLVPYQGAEVSLANEVRSSDRSGDASFDVDHDGSFTIEVKPRNGDKTHKPGKGQASLVDPLNIEDTAQRQRAQTSVSVTIVLPYQEPPKSPATPAPPQVTQTPQGANPSVPGPPRDGTLPAAPADAQLVADCSALLQKASVLKPNDLEGASALMDQAVQRNCAGVPGVANTLQNLTGEINKEQQEHNAHTQRLLGTIQSQVNACNYEGALATAQELESVEPSALPAANMGQLQKLAAQQANIRSLLALAQGTIADDQVQDTIAQLQEALATSPDCMKGQLQAALQRLQSRLALVAIRGRIQAAIAACDYIKALAAAQELQKLAPDDPWLAANLGLLQQLAAQQANIAPLLQSAREGPQENLGPLLAQLRQSLSSAPACMADQINSAINNAERRLGGQKPSWLVTDATTGDGQSRGDKNIDTARDTLLKDIQDEDQRRLKKEEEDRQRAELARQEEERRKQAALDEAERRRQEEEAAEQNRQRAKADEDERKRRDALQRRQQALNNLSNSLGSILGGGKVPIPAIPSGPGPSGGSAPESDPFVGSWPCHMKLISSRKMPLDGSVQGDYRELISKGGNGYILADGRSGSTMPSTSVSGNSIHFGAQSGSGSMTVDFQVNGNQMSGTLRGVNSEDSFAASLQCSR